MVFVEKENFLDYQFCVDLINLHQKYYPRIGRRIDSNHRECLDFYDCCHFLTVDNKKNDSDLIKKIMTKLISHSSEIDRDYFINYAQIVKWNIGSYQPTHLDFDYHSLTSIIYLNDDYQGGETVVDSNKITKKIGKIITFSGNSIEHSVLPIEKSERYTVAVWYKK